MKKIAKTVAISGIIMASVMSCNSAMTDPTTAGGKPYEVIASVDQELWNGQVGDTIKSIFMQEIPMFNQPEPMYDLVRVQPAGVKGLILQHRNLFIIKITDEVQKPVSAAQYDAYAKPQTILTVAAPDARSLEKYLSENRREIQTVFENAERERTIAAAKKYGEVTLKGQIKETFGIDMDIPKGYRFRNKINNDFIWISNEHGVPFQGLVVYSYPYSGKDDFLPENLLKRRNEFMSRIPGPSDGSYMITSEHADPEVRYLRIYDRSWAEMGGLWDVHGDFMGGPFLNFSTLDAATNRVIAIDCFVFAPQDTKRNYLRQLEHIVYSAQFPEVATPTVETGTENQ